MFSKVLKIKKLKQLFVISLLEDGVEDGQLILWQIVINWCSYC